MVRGEGGGQESNNPLYRKLPSFRHGKLMKANSNNRTWDMQRPSIRILDTTLVTVFASRPNTDKIRDELATVSPSLEPLISHS